MKRTWAEKLDLIVMPTMIPRYYRECGANTHFAYHNKTYTFRILFLSRMMEIAL